MEILVKKYFDYVQALFSIAFLQYVVFTWCENESKSDLSVQACNCSRKKKKRRLFQFDQSLLSDFFALAALCDGHSTFGSYEILVEKYKIFTCFNNRVQATRNYCGKEASW